MEIIKLMVFLLGILVMIPLAALFIFVRGYAREDMFKQYYGGKTGIYGGFKFVQYKYYRKEKQWACTALRILLVAMLLVLTAMYFLV